MCGVFGFLGKKSKLSKVVNGLKRLEYRGYDSWGLAFPVQGKIEAFKSLSAVRDIDHREFDFEIEFALGHTRWATHGAVNLSNCHPHISANGKFALVHNGIVENYDELKNFVIKEGSSLLSETDSEVILRLIEIELKHQPSEIDGVYQKAMSSVFNRLKGNNTIVLIAKDQQTLIGIRNGSPLVAGREDGNIYLASDCNAFAHHTNNCLLLDDRQMIICQRDSVRVFDLDSQEFLKCDWQIVENDASLPDKQHYAHFMLKEICEQWNTVSKSMQIDESILSNFASKINSNRELYITGAGAAFFIAEQIAWMFRQHTDIRITCVPAYDSEEYLKQMEKGDLLLAISQSGETADTLRFVQQARQKGVEIASVVNMSGAMLSRLSDYPFYSHAGEEVCVLSTKSGTSQLVFGYLLVAQICGKLALAKEEIKTLSARLFQYFTPDSLQDFSDLAERLSSEHIYILGRGLFLTTAKIAALNIKEASYIHAEAFSAGELKHGVLALIEKETPVICFVDKSNAEYMTAIASEVKARGAKVIGVGESPNPIFDFFLSFPQSEKSLSIASIIPCQILAYYLAVKRGLNPDRPRNLAKSVTVI